jgi:hypothetical protein
LQPLAAAGSVEPPLGLNPRGVHAVETISYPIGGGRIERWTLRNFAAKPELINRSLAAIRATQQE